MWINTETNAYPLFENDIRAALPNTSFAQPFSPPEPYAWVAPCPKPEFDPLTEKVVEATPESVDGVWYQEWDVVDLSPPEAVAAMEARNAQVYEDVVKATQARLDAFARTRGYDDIKSASDYAGCSVAKFDAEGTYCRDARAETWDKLYDMLAEVQAGTRPVPDNFSEIEPELPALVWPA
jgi:hypothetical protein